jgi:hypothetical protein
MPVRRRRPILSLIVVIAMVATACAEPAPVVLGKLIESSDAGSADAADVTDSRAEMPSEAPIFDEEREPADAREPEHEEGERDARGESTPRQ